MIDFYERKVTSDVAYASIHYRFKIYGGKIKIFSQTLAELIAENAENKLIIANVLRKSAQFLR